MISINIANNQIYEKGEVLYYNVNNEFIIKFKQVDNVYIEILDYELLIPFNYFKAFYINEKYSEIMGFCQNSLPNFFISIESMNKTNTFEEFKKKCIANNNNNKNTLSYLFKYLDNTINYKKNLGSTRYSSLLTLNSLKLINNKNYYFIINKEKFKIKDLQYYNNAIFNTLYLSNNKEDFLNLFNHNNESDTLNTKYFHTKYNFNYHMNCCGLSYLQINTIFLTDLKYIKLENKEKLLESLSNQILYITAGNINRNLIINLINYNNFRYKYLSKRTNYDIKNELFALLTKKTAINSEIINNDRILIKN